MWSAVVDNSPRPDGELRQPPVVFTNIVPPPNPYNCARFDGVSAFDAW